MIYTVRHIEQFPHHGDYEMHMVEVSTIEHVKKYKIKITGTALGLNRAVSGAHYAVSAALAAERKKMPASQKMPDDTILVDSNWQPQIIIDFGDGTPDNFSVDSDNKPVGFKIQ